MVTVLKPSTNLMTWGLWLTMSSCGLLSRNKGVLPWTRCIIQWVSRNIKQNDLSGECINFPLQIEFLGHLNEVRKLGKTLPHDLKRTYYMYVFPFFFCKLLVEITSKSPSRSAYTLPRQRSGRGRPMSTLGGGPVRDMLWNVPSMRTLAVKRQNKY